MAGPKGLAGLSVRYNCPASSWRMYATFLERESRTHDVSDLIRFKFFFKNVTSTLKWQIGSRFVFMQGW